MPIFVVPCTSVLPFGMYEIESIERKPFRNIAHLKGGYQFPMCNFVQPVRVRPVEENFDIADKDNVQIYMNGEVKTLKVLRIKKDDKHVVFMTPQCDAFYF